jgi:stearoyl-CoA desaturase (delta-9 desaturase)
MLIVLLAALVLPIRRPGIPELVAFVAVYAVGAFGIGVGYHRLITHKGFKTHPWLSTVLGAMGGVAGQGNVNYWVALHRMHHARSDEEGDPHSPYAGHPSPGSASFYHAHIGWMYRHGIPNPARWARDLIRRPDIAFVNRWYPVWFLSGLVLPAVGVGLVTGSLVGAASGLLWGGLVRACLCQHVIWSINSVCHMYGDRYFDTKDLSVNNALLAVPSFGESWHNNHHAAPNAAVHGMRTFQIDLSGMLIRALCFTGLGWDMRTPSAGLLAKRRADRLRDLGDTTRAVAAYERGLELHVEAGLIVKAAAIAKAILLLDSSREDVLERVRLKGAPVGPAPTRTPPSTPNAGRRDRNPADRCGQHRVVGGVRATRGSRPHLRYGCPARPRGAERTRVRQGPAHGRGGEGAGSHRRAAGAPAGLPPVRGRVAVGAARGDRRRRARGACAGRSAD